MVQTKDLPDSPEDIDSPEKKSKFNAVENVKNIFN